jgi:hypothetical protein
MIRLVEGGSPMNGVFDFRRLSGSMAAGLLAMVLLSGCGGGGSGSGEAGSNQGALALRIALANPSAAPGESEFPCEAESVATVEAEVLENETTVAEGGPWACTAHEGTINDVPAGSGLKVVAYARDKDGLAIFAGEVDNITVVAGETTDAGTIILRQIIDRAPVLDPIGNKSVDENQLLTINLIAGDPDEDRLTFSAFQILDGTTAELPAGASLTDNSNGTAIFQWKPDYGQSGVYTILFQVEDDSNLNPGPLSDSKSSTISVGNVNQTPVLAPIGNKNVTLVYDGECNCWTAELTFPISASDKDASDILSITAENMPKYADPLPPTVYDPACNCWKTTFRWEAKSYTEGRDDTGAHQVTFKVADSGTPSIVSSETITITVNKEELL